MTWNTDRRDRLPADWKTRRLAVLRRDRFRCQHRDAPDAPICGERANQSDHIIRGDDHELANLQALCQRHHLAKSGREGAAAKSGRVAPDRFPWSL